MEPLLQTVRNHVIVADAVHLLMLASQPRLKLELHLMTSCIGSAACVKTCLIFSNCVLMNIERILLFSMSHLLVSTPRRIGLWWNPHAVLLVCHADAVTSKGMHEMLYSHALAMWAEQ